MREYTFEMWPRFGSDLTPHALVKGMGVNPDEARATIRVPDGWHCAVRRSRPVSDSELMTVLASGKWTPAGIQE